MQPPLSDPGSGFDQLEVPQVEVVDGRPVLIFSSATMHLAVGRSGAGEVGGVWAAPIPSVTGRYPITSASRIADPSLYVGKLIKDQQGDWVFLAFVEQDGFGGFGGFVIDPLPVHWDGDRLRIDAQPESLPTGGHHARASA